MLEMIYHVQIIKVCDAFSERLNINCFTAFKNSWDNAFWLPSFGKSVKKQIRGIGTFYEYLTQHQRLMNGLHYYYIFKLWGIWLI